MEVGEGHEVEVPVNNDLTKLRLSANGNGASNCDTPVVAVQVQGSEESVDAFSFFGSKDKKENNGTVPQKDDGDSKGFW